MNSTAPARAGATVVITHGVLAGKQREYEQWLTQIGEACRAAPGHLDWQIIRPIAGISVSYTVVIRFDTEDTLRAWMAWEERERFVHRAQPLLADNDKYSIHSGLDFWFVPEGTNQKVPVRWKQFLITWSAIYPLAFAVPLAVTPLLRTIHAPDHRAFTTLCITAVIVFSMVFVVMPHYTRWVRRWLFE